MKEGANLGSGARVDGWDGGAVEIVDGTFGVACPVLAVVVATTNSLIMLRNADGAGDDGEQDGEDGWDEQR